MATSRRRFLAHLGATAAAAGGLPAAACRWDPQSAKAQPESPIVILAESTQGRIARVDAWMRSQGRAPAARALVVDVPGAPPSPGRPAPAAQVLAALAANPAAGHIVWQDHLDLPTLAARGALRALDALVRRDRYDLKRFMPVGLQSAYALDGRLCALPSEVDARQLYFNRDHFRGAGVDFRRAGF